MCRLRPALQPRDEMNTHHEYGFGCVVLRVWRHEWIGYTRMMHCAHTRTATLDSSLPCLFLSAQTYPSPAASNQLVRKDEWAAWMKQFHKGFSSLLFCIDRKAEH